MSNSLREVLDKDYSHIMPNALYNLPLDNRMAQYMKDKFQRIVNHEMKYTAGAKREIPHYYSIMGGCYDCPFYGGANGDELDFKHDARNRRRHDDDDDDDSSVDGSESEYSQYDVMGNRGVVPEMMGLDLGRQPRGRRPKTQLRAMGRKQIKKMLLEMREKKKENKKIKDFLEDLDLHYDENAQLVKNQINKARLQADYNSPGGRISPYLTNPELLDGGAWYDDLWSGIKKAANFVKDNKVISTVTGLIPHPAAQVGSVIAKAVGVGRHKKKCRKPVKQSSKSLRKKRCKKAVLTRADLKLENMDSLA